MIEIAYCDDGASLAARLADLPGFVFLDGALGGISGVSGWDLTAALPATVVSSDAHGNAADRWMRRVERLLIDGDYPALPAGFPFGPGAMGYLDYESGARAGGVTRDGLTPSCAGLYRAVAVQCHAQRKAWLLCDRQCDPTTRETLLARLTSVHTPDAAPDPNVVRLRSAFSAEIPKSDYCKAVQRIQDYLLAGDCYQVNYAHRFTAQFDGDSWSAYRLLRKSVRGEFSAYLLLQSGHAVLSLSPERFLSVQKQRVKTEPIKGTAARAKDPLLDEQAAARLRGSAKDRAENVMITDLLRNDLGRFCEPGSVQTPALCELRSYSNVHHLVSTVVGQLRAEVTPGQLLVACSPGGSITGAPKRRAMEIIRELEPCARGMYCGSVFTLSSNGVLQSSIAIRTLEAFGEMLYCWGGGGITVGSDPDAEYQETLDKVGALLSALPTQ